MLFLVLALQAAAPAPVPAPQPSPVAADKKICKSEDDTTSRIATRRVCRTAAEWAAISRDTQRQVRSSLVDRTHDR